MRKNLKTMKALFKKIVVAIITFEARLVLSRYKPKIIAITGSVGKTSTKDAIYTVLSPDFSTRKSEKSFNSELGVPLTILGLPNGWSNPFLWLKNIFLGFLLCWLPKRLKLTAGSFPDWLILEVGADRPGDIEQLSSWLKPDVVVITYFGKVPAHVEFFKSFQDVIREKTFLVKALKEGGTLCLNNDDEDVRALRDLRRDAHSITWSIEHESSFQASNFETTYRERDRVITPVGITFKINYDGNSIPMPVNGTVGRQQVYPILAALALGDSLGLNMISMAKSIINHRTPPGRMKLVAGIKASTIIDDTYNASPTAMTEALRALKETKTSGKKIAVLGDMLELGKHGIKAHENAGREATLACNILVTVGLRARDIAKGALENNFSEKNIFQFETSAEAAKPIEDMVQKGDLILVKGSQGARMEKIVEEIMAHPEEKEKWLVRQESEWQTR